jgi:microcystin-dependent protein
MISPLRTTLFTLALASTLLLSPTVVRAAAGPPSTIDYQGRVLDGSGAPLAPSTPTNYEIEFRIYDAPTGGTVIWAEKQLVTVLNGQFSVRLGEGQGIVTTGGAEEGSVGHASPGLPGAFGDSSRHLGITVKIPGQTPGEITPRLAFLAAPYSFSAAHANNIVQAPGTQSNLTVGSIAYATQTLSSSAAISGTSRTVLIDGTTGTAASPITATLPQSGAQKELLIAKTDATALQVVVAPPSGGNINGASGSIRLKVKGESVTLQNIGGNDWWVVNDNRDKTPVGTIISFGGNGPAPAGYLICDGLSKSRTDYPDLFAAIGTQWGNPNTSSFNLPQLAGRFLRGIDASGNGADDDALARFSLPSNPGGATGRNVGSYQDEAFRAHGHGVNDPGHSHGATAGAIAYRNFSFNGSANEMGKGFNPDVQDGTTNSRVGAPTIHNATTGISIQNNGGSETRPDNAGVRFCIKY